MNFLNKVSNTAADVTGMVSSTVLVSLAKAWIGIGMIKPATTNGEGMFPTPDWVKKQGQAPNTAPAETKQVDRFDYTGLWSLQVGEWFMPLSQTFTLRASKNLNISSLVDGIDIIQQVRHEAKMIDCSLRITVRENQNQLKIVDASDKVIALAKFLQEFYDKDAVLEIKNEMINNTFGVTHAFMTEYRFAPREGSMTYTFDFTLTEVVYGENVLTFDLRGLDSAESGNNQIGG